ncbi:hypothetical protein LNP17_26830 [Klebsiella variicola subsp. variicola]|nr:hypothetical protein [Klebsiella variicola subsp. variicola]
MNKGMNAYVKRKEKQLKTLGYEKLNYEMKFEIDSSSELISLARASLGYPEKINIRNIVSWSNRFNIKIITRRTNSRKSNYRNIECSTSHNW